MGLPCLIGSGRVCLTGGRLALFWVGNGLLSCLVLEPSVLAVPVLLAGSSHFVWYHGAEA